MSKETHKSASPAPFCLRLSREERARLEEEAGSLPLGAYIRARLFGSGADKASPPRRKLRRRVEDTAQLSQALSLLGRSRLSESLAELARAAARGFLPVSKETQTQIQEACRDVRRMREALLAALGHQQDTGDKTS